MSEDCLKCAEFSLFFFCVRREYLSRGVKLGGYNLWPFWHNISEPKCYPKCGSCNGTEMNVTFLHLDETAHRRKQKPVLVKQERNLVPNLDFAKKPFFLAF